MSAYAPGFINVHCRALGGEISISTAHIIGIAPPLYAAPGAANCIILLNTGANILVDISRDDVLTAIAEAVGSVPVGTGAEMDKIEAGIRSNTQTLIAAVQRITTQ